ncbi:E3 ubiquitin-protein ligase RGLG5-like [Anneissia japonica]|uniref:E3 ubiquitin-protein ligase RGLG5-like n=1 Tax=Anneissia japonica TaxID=1529436 RepID=UPI0014255404|nr:E3 ubiquitin-protein ligase RGLG5-like [Anneissia japonica]XP_033097764.1 E3 ubiquitin-protein ligase RGLG5-like [Anneissia japonica]
MAVQMFIIGALMVIIYKIYKWCTSPITTEDQKFDGIGNPPSYASLYPKLPDDIKVDSTSNLGRILGLKKSEPFIAIADRFTSEEEVADAIQQAGLESSNLIFGIDYTKSNLYQGKYSFGRQSLHSIRIGTMNPYQQVIKIIGTTLAPFDDDGLIPVFGFGDQSTGDKAVFPFRADGLCHGFQDVLDCYNQITPSVILSGPTNFAPLIDKAIRIVRETQSYHILVIIADGQVTREQQTQEAIVRAADYPLSIIMVGVGDGPWGTMKEFDNRLPRRKFDNFQFVDFHGVMRSSAFPEAAFALAALMELPDQFTAIRHLGLLDFPTRY